MAKLVAKPLTCGGTVGDLETSHLAFGVVVVLTFDLALSGEMLPVGKTIELSPVPDSPSWSSTEEASSVHSQVQIQH